MPRDTDMIPYACQRVYGTFTASTAASATDTFAENLQDAGWTLTSTGTFSGRPSYHLTSQQSPWWSEIATPPSTYVAKVRVNLYSLTTDAMNFRVMNEAETIAQGSGNGTACQIGTRTTGIEFSMNPYQFIAWGTGTQLWLASAPHTPRFIQEDLVLEECFFGDDMPRGFREGNHGLWSDGRDSRKLYTIVSSLGTMTTTAETQHSGPQIIMVSTATSTLGVVTGSWIANMDADPTFADPETWHPMLSPPMLAWRPISTSNIFMPCWLWDVAIINKRQSTQSILTMRDGREFRVAGGGALGSLYVCTEIE